MEFEKLFLDADEVTVLEELGAGSYGKVHRASVHEKQVAVKILHDASLAELSSDSDKLQELENEIKIMTENLHENIILMMGLCTINDHIAIIMELLHGDLDRLLVKGKATNSFTLFERLYMAKHAALGMNWLHSRKPIIIHRDLKLENLMFKKVGDEYIIKIADFGLAVVKPKHKTTVKGEVLGTPVTMAPEVLMKKPYHEKADIYSFGLCLWQIITCDPLFTEYNDYDRFVKAICVKKKRPHFPKEIREGHPELYQLVKLCWAHDPAERPSFQEINSHLDAILINTAIADPRGRRFWASNFTNQRNVPWKTFYHKFSKYMALDGDETLNERILKAIIQDCHKTDRKGEVVNIESFGHFLQWYGPLDKRGTSTHRTEYPDRPSYLNNKDKRTRDGMFQRIDTLLRTPWFHGNIDEIEARRRLQGAEEDTFLIRCSRNPGGFAITRTVANSKTPMSSRLVQSPKGFTTWPSEGTPVYHDTLDLLVGYLTGPFQWKPCKGSPFQELFEVGPESALEAYTTWGVGDKGY